MCCLAEPVEQQQQVVVQDDLHQLLDMLPADLGGLLINHPKRQQLIEVRALTQTTQGCLHTLQQAPVRRALTNPCQAGWSGSDYHLVGTPMHVPSQLH